MHSCNSVANYLGYFSNLWTLVYTFKLKISKITTFPPYVHMLFKIVEVGNTIMQRRYIHRNYLQKLACP